MHSSLALEKMPSVTVPLTLYLGFKLSNPLRGKFINNVRTIEGGKGFALFSVVQERTKGGRCQKCPVRTNVIYVWPLSEISVILVCFEYLNTQKDLSCSRLENKALLA